MVSCLVPSDRVTSPSRASSMPSPAVASSAGTGGQVAAQSPSQLDLGGFAASWSKRSSVSPRPSVTTLPSSALSAADSSPAELAGPVDGWALALSPPAPASSPAPAAPTFWLLGGGGAS